MIKKIFISTLLTGTLIASSCLVGCADSKHDTLSNIKTDETWYITIRDFGDNSYLIYDKNTKIVYIDNYTYSPNYVKTPYYAPNGKPYIYDEVTKRIKEIS